MKYSVVIVCSLLGVCVGASAADRPNVLLICVDDLKPLLGFYGAPIVHSPNINKLSARGVLFERAYCNQAVCSPSRNALLTSLRPTTLGIYDLATNFRKAAPNAVTLPQYFKQHGYHTEGLGKIFHTGHGNIDDAASWSVPSWKANVVAYALAKNRPPKGQTREAALFANVPANKAKRLPKGAAYESADVPDNAYPDGRTADEAILRLQTAAKKPQQPFFIAVGFVKPHLPFCAPKKYWDLYDPASFKLAERRTPPDGAPPYAATDWGELRNYAGIPDKGPVPADTQRTLIHGYHAAVTYMDAQVGRVIKALDENGLAENTIIVLWGDHGWHLGDHGMWCKHTNYEQATRIPLIIVDPRLNRASSHSDALVESVDVFPTLCELCGLSVPGKLDGSSFAAALTDSSAATKDAVFHAYPRKNLLGRAVRTRRYRLVEWKEPAAKTDDAVYELYDYNTDPGETKNLAGEQPEVVDQLRKILGTQPDPKPQLHAKAAKKKANKKAPRANKQQRKRAAA